YGLYTKNVIEDSRSHGIHVGHCDTDNLIRDNDIRRSGRTGVWFAGQGHKPFAPHRNRLEHNRITDSGLDDGVAVDIGGLTESVTLSKNELQETRRPLSRIGIRIGAEARDIRCLDNRVEGFATPVADLRKR